MAYELFAMCVPPTLGHLALAPQVVLLPMAVMMFSQMQEAVEPC